MWSLMRPSNCRVSSADGWDRQQLHFQCWLPGQWRQKPRPRAWHTWHLIGSFREEYIMVLGGDSSCIRVWALLQGVLKVYSTNIVLFFFREFRAWLLKWWARNHSLPWWKQSLPSVEGNTEQHWGKKIINQLRFFECSKCWMVLPCVLTGDLLNQGFSWQDQGFPPAYCMLHT